MLACEVYASDAENEYFRYETSAAAYAAVGEVWRYFWVLAGLPEPTGVSEERGCPRVAVSYAC